MMSTKSAKPLNVRKKKRQRKNKGSRFGSPFPSPIDIAIIYPIIIRRIHRDAAPCTDDAT